MGICDEPLENDDYVREDSAHRPKQVEIAPCVIVDKQVSPSDVYAQNGNHISANVAMTATASLMR